MILANKVISVESDPVFYEMSADRIVLNQIIDDAQMGHQVGIVFDIALDPSVLENPTYFMIERGDLNESTVRINLVDDGSTQLLQEVQHDLRIPDDLGRNPITFDLDLCLLTPDHLQEKQNHLIRNPRL